MKKLFLLILLLPQFIFGQPKMFDPPLSERIANYTIDCRLDPETKTVRGKEVLVWKNTSDHPVDELQFHLYQNAFSDEKSSLLSEMSEIPKEIIGHWGHCRISALVLYDGTDLVSRLIYIQPDDANPHDKTVCSVRLPNPVASGSELTLSITFETKLPPCVNRSGYEQNFFSVTQWFPKIGVYEDGGWNCHQYHSNGEFYADFGVYDVKVTVPEEYIVGASGILLRKEQLDGGLVRLHYYCEDVHDFAWCADTEFVEFKENYKGKVIRFLCQKDHVDIAHRFLKAVKVTFDYYGERYGEYPYPQITVIDSKHLAAVMEYPTLFQTGNFDTDYNIDKYKAIPLPESDKQIESLTIHEFGHNWWMGMIANNETDYVWLDEGINSYAATAAFEYGFGKYILENHGGVYRTIRDNERSDYLKYPKAATVLQPAWLYRPGWDEFFAFTYVKPEMMLLTLHNYFGDEIWSKVMKIFFQRWKFKHPKTEDFYDVIREVTGRDLKRFFDEYMTTTHTLDFEVGKVDDNKVYIKRNGALRFPVTVLVHFTDGGEEMLEWDNIRNTVIYDFCNSAEIEYVKIDPRHIIEFELDKKNNSWIK